VHSIAAPSGTTHTLERALAILRAFDGRTTPLSHSELVRRTGYSKASVSRIAVTLVSLGYLARDGDGVRFRMGLQGRMLGRTYRANSPLSTLARPMLQALADRFDMSVALGVPDGTEMLYVEWCRSPSTSTLCLAVGGRVPMELSAIGRAWLSAQPEHERETLLERIASSGRPAAAAAAERTRRAFEQIERDGWAIACGEYQRDSFGIAMPVRLGDPEVPLSLSFAGLLPAPDERRIRDEIAPALKAVAEDLRRALRSVDSKLF
jgi:DNA-binding IclR family transcriptional regulator